MAAAVTHPSSIQSLTIQRPEINAYFTKHDEGSISRLRCFENAMKQIQNSRVDSGPMLNAASRKFKEYSMKSGKLKGLEAWAGFSRLVSRVACVVAAVMGIGLATGLLTLSLPVSLCSISLLFAACYSCEKIANRFDAIAVPVREQYVTLSQELKPFKAQFEIKQKRIEPHVRIHDIIRSSIANPLLQEVTVPRKIYLICLQLELITQTEAICSELRRMELPTDSTTLEQVLREHLRQNQEAVTVILDGPVT